MPLPCKLLLPDVPALVAVPNRTAAHGTRAAEPD